MNETAEQISKQPEVREALDQTRGKKVKAQAKDKLWFVTHALLLISCGILYYLLLSHFIPLPYVEMLLRLVRGTVMIIVLLAAAQAASVYAIGSVTDASTRFTLKR